jgi:hypothetical protein
MSLAVLCALLLASSAAFGQIEDISLTFSYNGYLQTVGGEPVNQPLNFQFSIHADPEADAVMWEEEHRGHPVVNGVVQIELGLLSRIDPMLLSDPNLYLAVSIDRNAEMRPRLKLEAVLRAQWARHAKDVSGEIINPASVRINGQVVIDAAGQWAGGPTMTADAVRDAVVEVDGAGSGIDADTLDGLSSAIFVRNDQNVSIGGTMTAEGLESAQGLIINGLQVIDRDGNWLGGGGTTPQAVLDAILQVDGAGSGIDADLIDGISSDVILRNDRDATLRGAFRADALETAQGLSVNGVTVIDAAGVWLGAQSMTSEAIRDALGQVDGAGSTIDADLLDGVSSAQFLRSDRDTTLTGVLTADAVNVASGLDVNGVTVIDRNGNWLGADALTSAQVKAKLLEVDGAGSTIDADLLDGVSSAQFLRSDRDTTLTGVLTADGVNVNQSVGIGTASPRTMLDVSGAIRVGSEDNCDANHSGAIRFANGMLELWMAHSGKRS